MMMIEDKLMLQQMLTQLWAQTRRAWKSNRRYNKVKIVFPDLEDWRFSFNKNGKIYYRGLNNKKIK